MDSEEMRWSPITGGNTMRGSESEDEMTSKYSEKIRDQAARLRQLEIEKLQLEQEVQKLNVMIEIPKITQDPHPLQASMSDVLSPIKDANKIEDLELSLKAEILCAEEQRAYIEVLKTALEAQMDDIGLLNLEVDCYTEFTQIKDDFVHAKKEAKRLGEVVAEKEEKIQDQAQNITQSEIEVVNLNQINTQNERQLQVCLRAVKLAQETIQDLEITKLELTTEHEIALATISEQEQNFKQLLDENEQLKTDRDELDTANSELSLALEDVKGELDERERTIEAEKQTLHDLFAQLTDSQEEVTQLKDSIKPLQQNLESQKHTGKSAEGKLNNLQTRYDTLYENQQALYNTLRETQNEKDEVEQLYNDISLEHDSLQSKYRESTGAYEEGVANLNRLKNILAQLEAELKCKTAEIGSLQLQLSDAHAGKGLETERCGKLESTIKSNKVKKETWKASYAKLAESHERELSGVIEDLYKTQGDHQELLQHNNNQAAALAELKLTNNTLSAQIKSLTGQLESLNKTYGTSEEQKQKVMANLSRSQEALGSLRSEKLSVEEKCSTIEKDFEELMCKNITLEGKISTIEQEHAEQLSKTARVGQEATQRLGKIKTLEDQITHVNTLNDRLASENTGLSTRSRSLVDEIAELRQELDTHRINQRRAQDRVAQFGVIVAAEDSRASQKFKEFVAQVRAGDVQNFLYAWTDISVDEITTLLRVIRELMTETGNLSSQVAARERLFKQQIDAEKAKGESLVRENTSLQDHLRNVEAREKAFHQEKTLNARSTLERQTKSFDTADESILRPIEEILKTSRELDFAKREKYNIETQISHLQSKRNLNFSELNDIETLKSRLETKISEIQKSSRRLNELNMTSFDSKLESNSSMYSYNEDPSIRAIDQDQAKASQSDRPHTGIGVDTQCDIFGRPLTTRSREIQEPQDSNPLSIESRLNANSFGDELVRQSKKSANH